MSQRGTLPRILAGRRRAIFARLLCNGFLQATVALGLPFVVFASEKLAAVEAAVLLGLLAGTLVILRIRELIDAEQLGLDYVAQVRMALFDGLANGTASTSHGVAMSRLMNDLSALKNWVGLGVARSIVAVLAFSGCLVAAASISMPHAAVIAAPVLLVALAASMLVVPLLRRVAEVRRVRGKLAGQLGETLLSLGVLRAFELAPRSRRRIRKTSRALNAALGRRMRMAGSLRAFPEAILPCTAASAILFGLPLRADSVSLLLLAGLAITPVRQILRAIEYRCTFLIARDRLAKGLGVKSESDPAPKAKPARPAPGLQVLQGPVDEVWEKIAAEGMTVTASAPLFRRSLRRNIDIAGKFRGNDDGLCEIAEFCGLLEPHIAPDGLDTRLLPEDTPVTEGWQARLSLARALAFGVAALAVNAPVLLVDAKGRAMLRALPDRFGVHLKLAVGDLDFDELCNGAPSAALTPDKGPSGADASLRLVNS